MPKRPFSSFCFLIVALVAYLSLPAMKAQAVINDNAKLFSQSAIDQAQQTIDYIKVHHHKDVSVETFPSASADGLTLDKDKPEEYFQKWAQQRGTETKTDGVYVLICMDPHYVQVEVGNRTQTKEFTVEDGKNLSDKIRAALKAGENDRALTGTANFVKERMHANTAGESSSPSGASSPAPAYAPPPAAGGGGTGGNTSGGWHLGFGSLICVGIAILLLVALFRGMGRSSNQYPPQQGGYPPNYQGGAYPPNYQGGAAPRGGGFGSGLLGGLLGGALGGWGYDELRNRGGGGGSGWTGGGGGGGQPSGGGGGDFSTSSGQDTGFSDAGGGGFDSGGGGGGFDSGGGGGGGDSGSGGSF